MTDKAAVAATGMLVSALGGSLVLVANSRDGPSAEGALRASLLVLLVALASLMGYRLYRSQPKAAPSEDELGSASRACADAIRDALLQVVPIVAISALLLDGGVALRVTLVAALGHAAASLLILARRSSSPTALDLALIRYGFWLALGIVALVGPMARKMAGQD